MTPPDSGEREVLTAEEFAEMRKDLAHIVTDGDAREWVEPLLVEVERARAGVVLPLSLAQRILAALEEEADAYDADDPQAQRLYALESELRERMPK